MKTVSKVKLYELCNVKNMKLGSAASICINQVLRSDLRKKLTDSESFSPVLFTKCLRPFLLHPMIIDGEP
jgi:hypothetical protein